MVLRCPVFNSRMPAWTVVRDRPVARATNDTPPKGKDLASAAAHTRRPRSSNRSPTTRYFSRIAPSSFGPMHQEYTVYLIVQVIYAHTLRLLRQQTELLAALNFPRRFSAGALIVCQPQG